MNLDGDILNQVYLGNSLREYCIVAGLVLLGVIFQKYLARLLSNLIYRGIKRYTEDVDNDTFFELLHKPLKLFILLVIVYSATDHIEVPPEFDLSPKTEFGLLMIIERAYMGFVVGSITWAFLQIVEFIGIVLLKKADKTESKQDDQFIPFAIEMLKIVVVVFSVFFILGSVFDVNIGSLIAGLGIGGLALALAAKESLENLLGSFTIFFDKPFVVGDFVKVGDISGSVEKVGFRSTRLRTLEKSYLTVPNKKMIDAELDNMSLRTFRRARFSVGLVYGTSIEQIKAIVSDIQEYIDNHENTNQDGKVKFTEFGASSLDILVQYYVDTMDWGIYLDVQQEINFRIMEIVAQHGSDFAFPTQTLHIENPG